MLKEFRDFAFKGSLIDVAVGFIMAAAIGAVVKSLVEHIFMPFIAIFIGQPSFDNLRLVVNNSEILYGSFITALVNFIAIAAVVFFFIVKPYERFRKKEEAAPPPGPSAEEQLLTEIRDLLKTR